MSTKFIAMETFLNKDDADLWLDIHLYEHVGMDIIEAYVKYVNGAWQAGCMLGDKQLELDID